MTRQSTKDLTDGKFGRLTALKFTGRDKHRHLQWLCCCDCGNITTVSQANLMNGHTKSCGCLKRERKGSKNVSYGTTHWRLRQDKTKPKLCQRCKERPATELSYDDALGHNLNEDKYEWLCKSCHNLKDRGNGVVLTKARIHRIREFYKCGAATQQELAVLFKVTESLINRIINYQGIYQKQINPRIFQNLIKDLKEVNNEPKC